ncbi:MAG: asparaginase [Pseudomonadota bacterium]
MDQDLKTSAVKAAAANPLLVEVQRGDMVESRHRAAYAVVNSDGKVMLQSGDIERPIYPRSAIKPLQALALVETGAAEAFGLGDAEIALACASHIGEACHTETVAAWLARIGCTPADLECGPHLPYDEAAMVALLRAGGDAGAIHNNCSGKHSGFLTVARHLGVPTKGYINYNHPVQQRVLGILESMTGLDLGNAPRAIDGCSIPTIGVPLGNVALAMARLANPSDQPEHRRAAALRIRKAMAAQPVMVAGTGHFCTRVLQVTGERAAVKAGAEGVYSAAIPELGLGIALKVDDGAARAAEVLLARLLVRLKVLSDADFARLNEPLLNRAGRVVGGLEMTGHAF